MNRSVLRSGIFCGALAAVLMFSVSPALAGLNQWTTNGPNDSAIINSIAVDPNAPLTVYAATSKTTPIDGKVFKSTDGGGSWNPMTTGLPGSSVDIIVVDSVSPSTLYVGTLGSPGVLKSTNGGANWQPMNTGLAVQSIVSLAIDPLNPSILFAGTTSGQANGAFRSTNGGQNWSPVGTGLPNAITSVLAVDPVNSQNVYAGMSTGFFKSTNGGGSGSWVSMNNGFTPDPTPAILAIAINPQDTNTIYVGTGGFGVWKSVNGGGNWTAVNTGLTDSLVNGLVLDPQRPNVLYAATNSSGVFRSTNGGDSWTKFGVGQPANTSFKSVGISKTGTCVHLGTNVNGATGQVFDYSMVANCGPMPAPVPPLAAAVLPSSRSVQVGTAATAFVTMINTGATPAVAAYIAPPPGLAANFSYQTTNPATNQPIGTPNVPVDIPPGGTQTYVISLSPTTAIPPVEVAFIYLAENSTGPTPILLGVNTLLLSSSFSPIPDIVALALTLSGDGIVHLPGSSGQNAFAVASVNVGAGANITVSADTGGASLPLTLFLCETNPNTGQCLGAGPQPSVTIQIGPNGTPTFTVFVIANGSVAFDPATNRVFVRFKDVGNVTRGSTSVAVTTQ